jgi:hypothetical protein
MSMRSIVKLLIRTLAAAVALAGLFVYMNAESRENVLKAAVCEEIPRSVRIHEAAGPSPWPLSQNYWVSFTIPEADLDAILDRERYTRDGRANWIFSGSVLRPPPWWPPRVVASGDVAVYRREDDPSSGDKSQWSAMIVYMESTSECFAMKSYNW